MNTKIDNKVKLLSTFSDVNAVIQGGDLCRSIIILLLGLSVSCANVSTRQSAEKEVWREVPQTAPVSSPRNYAQKPAGDTEFAPPAAVQNEIKSGSVIQSRTQIAIATAQLPVIEPLRKPLRLPKANATSGNLARQQNKGQVNVNTSASKAGAEQPAKTKIVPAAAQPKPVITGVTKAKKMTEKTIAATTSQAGKKSDNKTKALALKEKAAKDKMEKAVIANAKMAKATKANLAKANLAKANLAKAKLAKAKLAKAKLAKAKATKNGVAQKVGTSDIELMCTEVIASLIISSDSCAILDASIEGVGFVPGSAELTESAKEVLDSVTAVMKKKENLRLSIATYSRDLDDSDMGNLLERRRTLTVIRYLIDDDIDGARVLPHTAPLESELTGQSDASQYLVVLRSVAE